MLRVSPKRIPSLELFPNSGLGKISPGTSIVVKCFQQETDDLRLLITLSIQPCVQSDGRDAARRAGLSASAETCTVTTTSSPVADCGVCGYVGPLKLDISACRSIAGG